MEEHSQRSGDPASDARDVWRFVLASIAVVVVVGLGASEVLRRELIERELREARDDAAYVAGSVVEPAVTPGLLDGDPRAVEAFGDVVESQVLQSGVTRVKLWRADGTVLWSEEPKLIGRRYDLRPGDAQLVQAGEGVSARPSPLDDPEHELDADDQEVNEVYVAIRGPGGEPLLWEAYLARDGMFDEAGTVLGALAPVSVAAVLLFLAVQLPFAVGLARRAASSERKRLAALRRAGEVSHDERRRIASDLHDGVVQDLTAVALELSAAAERAEHGERAEPEHLRDASERLRHGIRGLRTLVTDIYPPNLHVVGLPAALADLLDRFSDRVDATLEVDPDLRLPPETERLLYRAAQEGVRNAAAHAGPCSLHLRVTREAGQAELVVSDDGRGFAGSTRDAVADGHVGLHLLAGMAEAAGGRLTVDSSLRAGTELRKEVPA